MQGLNFKISLQVLTLARVGAYFLFTLKYLHFPFPVISGSQSGFHQVSYIGWLGAHN